MLLEAFGAEAIDRIEDKLLVEPLRNRLAAWLGTRDADVSRSVRRKIVKAKT
jgi:hypothetical protein